MIVTPDAPLKAVKTAVEKTATTARPPGIHPKSACARLTSRFGPWLSARTYPANVNSGMAMSAGKSTSRYSSAMRAAVSMPAAVKASSPIAEMTANSGAPTKAASASTPAAIHDTSALTPRPLRALLRWLSRNRALS